MFPYLNIKYVFLPDNAYCVTQVEKDLLVAPRDEHFVSQYRAAPAAVLHVVHVELSHGHEAMSLVAAEQSPPPPTAIFPKPQSATTVAEDVDCALT
jgi:hypothetical protein